MKRILSVALIIVTLIFCISGCSKSVEEKFVGTWELVDHNVSYTPLLSKPISEMTLYSDGTCKVGNESGTWRIIDGTLEIGEFYNYIEITCSNFSFKGDQLILENVNRNSRDDGDTMIYKRVK